ncbi:MAG: hypothetical protein ABGZ35_05815 [Planctomycetaceae bacterium]
MNKHNSQESLTPRKQLTLRKLTPAKVMVISLWIIDHLIAPIASIR